jgi:hypothetical protein
MDTRTQGLVGTLPLGSGGPPARECVGVQLDEWKLVVASNAPDTGGPGKAPEGLITVHDIRAAGRAGCTAVAATRWSEPLVSLPAPGRITCFQVGQLVHCNSTQLRCYQ